jgi:RNA polymerase sigma-70 factor (ECF subfamily)
MVDAPTSSEERISAEALFRAHAQFVASFLHRFGVFHQDIDDMVQEVFIVAHRKGGYVRGPAQPRTWLAAIAVHVAQSSRRARTRRERNTRPATDESVELAKSVVDPHQHLESRRAIERLQQALDGLPAEHRAAFMLYEIEGESCESIAAEWNVPIGTVYSRLHSARRRVLEAYAQEGASTASLAAERRALQHASGES